MRRRPRPRSLGISDDSEAKLASRGLSLADAEFALEHRPAWMWQRSKKRPSDEGLGKRPGRWVMTGRGLEADLATFVLEAPDRMVFRKWLPAGLRRKKSGNGTVDTHE